jgi:hypothetical protein
MSIRVVVLCGLLALSTTGFESAAASEGSDKSGLPKGQVELVTDAKVYMARIENTVTMANRGEYGKLRRGADARLRQARDRIAELLAGKTNTDELQGKERVALVDAEETIKSVIRNDDRDRIVCTLSAGTGSRLATKECMTIAQREERAKVARRLVQEQSRAVFERGNQ